MKLGKLLCSLLFLFCARASNAQTVPVVSLQEFQSRVLRENDTLYVVNFWATYCGPCVKELPHFSAAQNELSGKPVKFILVSLDATYDGPRVAAFVQAKKLRFENMILNGGDPNVWINALEPSWQGSIPATFLFSKGSKLSFSEGAFSNKKELLKFINNHK